MHLPIRLRLTLVFTLIMAILLAVTGSFVYLQLGAEMLRATDTALMSEADAVAAGLGQQGATFNTPTAANARGLGTFAQVLGPGAKVLESSPGLAGRPAVPPPALRTVRGAAYFDEKIPPIRGTSRIVVLPQGSGRQRVWVLAGASSRSRDEVLAELLVLMLAGGPVMLALAAAAGWAVAGAALRPVERMRQQAEVLSVSDRDRRLPIPPTHDEIARLGTTLNAMLGRLEAAFERERRFVDDASHELRTPLAILKAELDLAQSRPRTHAELLAAVCSAAEETDRLACLAATLLVYARAEAGRIPLHRQPAGMDQLLRDACTALAGQAAAAGIPVRVDPHGATAAIDPARVRQAVENLVSNALAHTPRGGQIHASATITGGTACLTIHDTGPGFDPAILPRVFEPFATSPAPHTRTGQGTGLGLAIVRAIAQAHGGDAVADNPPSGGARVALLLPASL